TPTRVACNIDHGRQNHLDAAGADLSAGDREDPSQQIGVPGACERNRLRKAGGIAGCKAVQSFLVKQDWNTQSGILQGVTLDGIHEGDCLSRVAEGLLQWVVSAPA